MTEQRFLFDEVAALYARRRPGYPPELFDAVASWTGLAPGDRVLEVGCGSGQATADLVARGYAVTAIEPGPRLLALAREHVGADAARWFQGTIESWPLQGGFALLASAQAFHWVDPDVRFRKAAKVLAPGGHLALFANHPEPHDADLEDAIQAAYAREVPELAAARGAAPGAAQRARLPAELDAAEGFGPIREAAFEWSETLDAVAYVELLETQSDHRRLPAARRSALHRDIADVIRARGDAVEQRYVARLLIAARVPAPGTHSAAGG